MVPLFRTADPAPGESFALLRPGGSGFSPLWHTHGLFELNHIVAGRGIRWVGTRSERFAEGDIVLVPPDLPHSWNSDSTAPESTVDAIVAMFAPDLLGGANGPPEWRAARALLDDANEGFAFDDPDGTIADELRRMADAPAARRLLGLLAVLDMLARAPRRRLSHRGDAGVDVSRDLALVRRALARLRDPASPPANQGMLARDFGVSTSRLSRAFRRITGATFTSYVNELRISRACRLLQRDELSVAQVSFEAGYANLSNFNRRFKAITGRTPREYRRGFIASMAPARLTNQAADVSIPRH